MRHRDHAQKFDAVEDDRLNGDAFAAARQTARPVDSAGSAEEGAEA
jgi:hypothetical protein